MRELLNHTEIERLVIAGYSYREIVEITGFNKNSVYGWCLKKFGKMEDRNKSRRQTIDISQVQKEILFGTLLGDGNITKVKNSYQGRTNHSLSQIEYCTHKRSLLENLTYEIAFTDKKLKQFPDKIYKQCYFCLKPNENLKDLYLDFYINGKKDVPLNLDLLTPQALAIWFMDDGTKSGKCSISIATCSFSLEGLLRLKSYLKFKYDLDVIIQKDFKIYFNAKSGRKFYDIVKPYIIESMKYKFEFVNSSADLKLCESGNLL